MAVITRIETIFFVFISAPFAPAVIAVQDKALLNCVPGTGHMKEADRV
jgi:hypothetical protein